MGSGKDGVVMWICDYKFMNLSLTPIVLCRGLTKIEGKSKVMVHA